MIFYDSRLCPGLEGKGKNRKLRAADINFYVDFNNFRYLNEGMKEWQQIKLEENIKG